MLRWLTLAVVLALPLGGCPRELEPPPASGEPCADRTDCNAAGLTCGELRLCVGGHCEAEPSLHLPCR